MVYSIAKIAINTVDVNDISINAMPTPGILFSYFFSTTFLSYVMFYVFNKEKKVFNFDFFENFSIFKKNVNLFVFQITIPVLTGLLLFSVVIFPRIPFCFCGAKPLEVNIDFKNNTLREGSGVYYLLGEGDDSYLLAYKTYNHLKVMRIGVDDVNYISFGNKK